MTPSSRSPRRASRTLALLLAAPLLAAVLLSAAAPALGVPALGAQPTRADPVDVQAWYGGALTVDLPRRWETQVDYRVRYQDNASRWLGSYVTTELSRGVGSGWRLGELPPGPGGGSHLPPRGCGAIVGTARGRRAGGGPGAGAVPAADLRRRRRGGERRRRVRAHPPAAAPPPHALAARVRVHRAVLRPRGDFPVDNWRNTIGTEWDLGKGRALDLFYIHRPDYGKRSYNRTFHVIGVQLELDWKP